MTWWTVPPETPRESLAFWCPHRPHPKQREFLDSDAFELLFGGAASGGKSDVLLMGALEYVHVPSYAALLVRRTYRDLALPGAIMDRARTWLGGTEARWNDLDKTWRFPSGATLTFGYLDGPRDHFRYQGAELQYIGFDELTQFHEHQYQYLFSRLRRTRAQTIPLRMRSASNPGDIGHRWVKARFVEGKAEFIPARARDNLSMDHESYERALEHLDPVRRRQLRDGEWIEDTSGLVYTLDTARNVVASLPELVSGDRWHRVLAIDFGVVDSTAFAVIAFSEHDPRAFVEESEQWRGMSPSDAAERVKQWRARFGEFDRIVGDVGGLGKGFATEMIQRHYIPIEPAEKANKLGYIKLLNGDLTGDKLFVVGATNQELIEQAAGLIWKDESRQHEHPGCENHLTDAMLYGWRAARHWLATEKQPDRRNVGERYEDKWLSRYVKPEPEGPPAPEEFEWIRQ